MVISPVHFIDWVLFTFCSVQSELLLILIDVSGEKLEPCKILLKHCFAFVFFFFSLLSASSIVPPILVISHLFSIRLIKLVFLLLSIFLNHACLKFYLRLTCDTSSCFSFKSCLQELQISCNLLVCTSPQFDHEYFVFLFDLLSMRFHTQNPRAWLRLTVDFTEEIGVTVELNWEVALSFHLIPFIVIIVQLAAETDNWIQLLH